MLLLRVIYNKTGEILAVLIILGICCYVCIALTGSGGIITNETAARNIVKEIYRLEMRAWNSVTTGQRFLQLSQIEYRSPALRHLEKIRGGEAYELFNDGDYYYYLLLDIKPQQAEEYIAGNGEPTVSGFIVLAWPVLFAISGELVFFIDQHGKLLVSRNRHARYEGLMSFPPDLKDPVMAAALADKDDLIGPIPVKKQEANRIKPLSSEDEDEESRKWHWKVEETLK